MNVAQASTHYYGTHEAAIYAAGAEQQIEGTLTAYDGLRGVPGGRETSSRPAISI